MKKHKRYWDRQYLEQQLESGKNYADISRENGRGKSTIQRALHHYGLTNSPADWSERELSVLRRLYGRVRELGEHFPNRTAGSICHKANRLGLASGMRFRRYGVDEKFFASWNSKMAYVLGWMFSDGNVSPGERAFRIKLSARDSKILRRIREVLKAAHPLKTSLQATPSGKKFAKYAILSVSSRSMCKDLSRLGCVARKASRFSLPEIPRQFLRHFVRGYFDGDGSISMNKPNTVKISFVSCNSLFIRALADIFRAELKIPPNYKRVKTNLWRCGYYGDNARKICKWMYANCGKLFLERKRIRFVRHMQKRSQNA